MPLKKVKQEIKVLGRKKGKDVCPNCVKLDEQIKKKLPTAKIPTDYKFIDESSKTGKEMSSKYKIKYIPFVEQCTTYSNGKSRCKVIR